MKRLILALIIFLTMISYIETDAQYYPHKIKTDYLENFRGQFHFSPKTEWMNDINGLVFQDGKYHMIYQWGKTIRHGGYATSYDLLHWQDEGVALIPQKSFLPADAIRNVTGNQVFSGSAVIVSGTTAKAITGFNKEAIIAIYTGTGSGTCLAWSNDNGRKWNDYINNPVAHLTDSADPRDPCVIWHKESSKWILALYENGTTFYGSDDLINWNFLSNIDFGFECPDLFQLPVDGNKENNKWILQDANGSYLVGNFDGKRFKMDSCQDTLIMDVGPDFYAAQTFPANNLPNNDERIIQIAWMDHWNGGIGEKVWQRNATFPVELGLTKIENQIRITRIPIREISNLYKESINWSLQEVNKDNTLLSEVKSKTFELIAEFDLSKTLATKFGFQIANKTIEYDVKNKTLLTKKIVLNNTKVIKIRILVDWGQLEVFANDGVFSFTEQFAFNPERNDLEFFSNGKVILKSMQLNKIKRIW